MTEQFEHIAQELFESATRAGVRVTRAQVRDLLWEVGIGDLLEDLETARSVIRAADGFHPVARFFIEGSEEREFILRVLSSGS